MKEQIQTQESKNFPQKFSDFAKFTKDFYFKYFNSHKENLAKAFDTNFKQNLFPKPKITLRKLKTTLLLRL